MQRADAAEAPPPNPRRIESPDRRLWAAASVLEQGRIEVLTLDVFDTLVWRAVPEPVDAFLTLGRSLRERGILAEEVHPQAFAHLRCRAEAMARTMVATHSGAQEIGLEAIYDRMPWHLFRGQDPRSIVDLEINLEAELTRPDLDIVEFARSARDRYGVRVALVSDTYFSGTQLRRVLSGGTAVDLELDHVFTSSDHGVGKGFGLFDVVLEELEVAAASTLHIGDHPISDVAAPGRLGIHAVHFEKFTPSMAQVVADEFASTRDLQWLAHDVEARDSGLTALRSKALARRSQESSGAAVHSFWRCGAGVLGPVMTGFAAWVHDVANDHGVETAYCLMREGEFVSRLLDGARPYASAPVRAEKLWASRHVTARAGILEASTGELVGFLHRRKPPTVREFLESIGLSMPAVPEFFAHADGRLDDRALLDSVLDLIERRPDLRASIVASSAVIRERLVSSIMKKVGDAPRMLVVDLGWGATIQHNLQRVLRASGVDVEVIGAYLMTNDAAIDRVLNGLHADAYLASVGIPQEMSSLVSRSPEIIEQVFMHDVGTLQDFTPDGEPVCGPVQQRPVQMLQRTAVQNGILDFQREWARYHAGEGADRPLLTPASVAIMLRILHRFLTRPTAEEAAMFAAWLHDDNFGSADTESVLNPELSRLVRYMTPDQYLALPSTRTFWPYGLATIYDQQLAKAAAAIASGAVTADAFNRSEQHFMPIYLDDGSGPQERVRTPVRLNGAGLCFSSTTLDARAVHVVRVAFPGGPGVVRVDWMRFRFHVRGDAAPTEVVLELAEDFETVSFDHCQRIASNVLVGEKQAPQLSVECDREWRDEVFKVEIEAAFGWLPTTPSTISAAPVPPPPLTRVVGRSAARALRRTRSALLAPEAP